MSLNDTSVGIGDTKGTDVVIGVGNPIASGDPGDRAQANFVNDPGSSDKGAGAGPDFKGDENARRELRQQGSGESAEATIGDTQIEPIGEDPAKASTAGSVPFTERDESIASKSGVAAESGGSESASADSVLEQVADAAKAALASVTGGSK